MLGLGPCCCTDTHKHPSGCSCDQFGGIPDTLNLTVTNPGASLNQLQSCTLTYRGVVAPYNTTLTWLSTATFNDGLGRNGFRISFRCSPPVNEGLQYVVAQWFPAAGGVGPLTGPTLYSWVSSFPGNSCNPFLFGNGVRSSLMTAPTTATLDG